MPNFNQRTTIKSVFAMLVIAIFIVFSGLAFRQQTQTVEYLTFTQKAGAYAASEVDRTALGLAQGLELVGEGLRESDYLLLKFDLLWARLKTVRNGSEAAGLRELPGAQQTYDDLYDWLDSNTAIIENLQSGDKANADQLLESFTPFLTPLRQFSFESYLGDEVTSRLNRANSIQQNVNRSIIIVLISGAFLIILLLQESNRNYWHATHDSLTRLPNRKLFNERLMRIHKKAADKNTGYAVLVVDLNNFKEINDNFGHAYGDAMLVHVSQSLQEVLGDQNLIFRMGGDEFSIIREGVNSISECENIAEIACQQIKMISRIKDINMQQDVSVGVSFYPEDGQNAEDIVANADIAMYHAKRLRSGTHYRLFTPDMRWRKRVSRALRNDIIDNNLTVHYQPIVDLKTGKIYAIEALLRWYSKKYGYINPLEAFQIADQYGLSEMLNHWVIYTACKAYRGWHQDSESNICLSINISPVMYRQNQLANLLSDVFHHTNFQPENLVLEITENTAMQDLEATPGIMQTLKALGVQIALDDFGTGLSSLSHLRELPIDKLKLDRSFVKEIDQDEKDAYFVECINALATKFDMQLVAEGIETKAMLDKIRDIGCAYGQGYLFDKAVTAQEMQNLISRQVMGENIYQAHLEKNHARKPKLSLINTKN
ncbi:putative bifunctional diguanylate cyclase/phosphodiesterase [Ostreibacterium oceani]|uniref:EAL domain-containing protein n=1 Tax=Ostreibacterium oceani TaxID=2654998 RepID=A0A6N7EXY3_9GAMM|nr:EAL domain-containing protein [Ostreibacterium oceani]MPV86400.1 EAL domain-containing protein [Ostreibacterium oceani]